MPARDYIHNQVKTALERDGWQVISDPLFIPVEGLSGLYVDLAVQEIVSAEKDGKKIVIEIKGFGEQSLTHDFYEALGQAITYETALRDIGVDWPLFLAIPKSEFIRLQKIPLFLKVLKQSSVKVIVIDIDIQKVTSWQI